MQIGKKGSFAATIAAIGIIALIFAINTQIQNNYSNNVFLETQSSRELSIKMEQITRAIDKALTYLINEKIAGNNCNLPPGQIESAHDGIKQKLNNALKKIYETTNIKCSEIENLTDEDPSNDIVKVEINLNCAIKFENTKIEQTKKLNLEKQFYENNGICIIKDSVSNCQESPNFNCP